jgi:hypothetical protein
MIRTLRDRREHGTRLAMLLLCLLVPAVASAAPDLIAIGTISGTYEDFATETAGPLENGAPGNRLGGMGSGLAYAGGNTFIALPDRGPNAVEYNAAVDDTASYINRFHTLNLSLAPSDPGSALPFTLTPMLTATTLLSSVTPLHYGSGAGLGLGNGAPALNQVHHLNYFSGRSDNFDPARVSTDPRDGRLDPESVRVSADGRSVFITDEYGPYVYQFHRATGIRIRAFALPARFAVSVLSPVGDTEISGNTSGRVANKGMEGLAITPDGKTLVGIMQSPLIQDGGTDGSTTRIVTIDVRTGATREYAYTFDNIGTAKKPKYGTASEIVAVNGHEFLVDERDGKGLGDGSVAVQKKIYKIDLAGALDVSQVTGAANLAAAAVGKTPFLDVVSVLTAKGIGSANIPAKLEGMAFGQDVLIGGVTHHTLYVSTDNDYISLVIDDLHPDGMDNPNTFLVFAFTDADLPGFVHQQIRELHPLCIFSPEHCDD